MGLHFICKICECVFSVFYIKDYKLIDMIKCPYCNNGDKNNFLKLDKEIINKIIGFDKKYEEKIKNIVIGFNEDKGLSK